MFVSPDDEHDELEKCRKLKIKINTKKRIVRHVGHLPRTHKVLETPTTRYKTS
jgi:hypothetical protein